MKIFQLTLVILLFMATFCFAQDNRLLLDNFEFAVSGGPDGTVDFGAGGGSSVELFSAADIQHQEKMSLKIVYDAVAGGYIWVARGSGLDAKNAGWLVKPEEIDWGKYNAFSFYINGAASGADIAFDIKDKGQEIWRFMFKDDFKGWKEIISPLGEFFVRTDWQPESAEKNGTLDFPIKSYQFEPRPVAKGAIYIDEMELIKQ